MTTAEAPAPPQLETISIDVNGDIGTLTLNRPKVLNAMSPELIGELVTAAAKGELALPVDGVFGLDQIAAAVRASREPGRKGKVVLRG